MNQTTTIAPSEQTDPTDRTGQTGHPGNPDNPDNSAKPNYSTQPTQARMVAHRREIHERFALFSRNVYEPKLHLLFAMLWSLSLQAVLTGNQPLSFGVQNILVGLSFFLVLFYLRAVDEIKDLDYDKIYNKDRPLVKGDVTTRDVWVLIGLLASAVLVLNLFISLRMALFLTGTLTYGLGLMALEKFIPKIKDNLLLNLAVTFPVSASLNFYALYFLTLLPGTGSNGEIHFGPAELTAIAGYMAAFLHFEFGRKTQWRSVTNPGERFYSQPLGNIGAQVLCHLLGVAAITLVIAAVHLATDGTVPAHRWIVTIAVVPSALGAVEFFIQRDKRIKARPYYVAYLALFYLCNMLMWI